MAIDIVPNQMTAKWGIKLFRERAVAEILKEYKQLYDKNAFERLKPPKNNKRTTKGGA